MYDAKIESNLPTYDIKLQTHDQYEADTSIILHVLIQEAEIPLKVVSAKFLLVSLVSLKESICETRNNVFYFTSKALFVLEIIKF